MMNTKVRTLGLVAIFFGVVALAMGIVFVQQGYAKEAFGQTHPGGAVGKKLMEEQSENLG